MSLCGMDSTVCLREATGRDVDGLLDFLRGLSTESQYFRFMGLRSLDPAAVNALLSSPGRTATSLVAESGGRIVAFAGFYRTPESRDRAEVAFAVADALHGHGIGTRMLEQLARLAREQDIAIFDAYVMGTNHRMMQMFRDSGFPVTSTFEDGLSHVVLSLRETEHFTDAAATRSRLAATASMKGFFEPRTVAVVGANRERGKIGAEILHNIMAAGFTGTVIPVHASAGVVQGLKAYARVADIPVPVDLAVIVVPAAHVLDAVDDCIRKSVRAICVISAGFAECDAAGQARETALVARVREAGCRLIGPNCMGLLNTNPAVRLNATFSPVYPPAGRVAMSTQSGALGLAILDYAKRLNIGISTFVSVGNKPDVSGNDLIQYWGDDPATSRHPALPRELRQSSKIQSDCAPCCPNEAYRRGQGGTIERGITRRRVAHRGACVQRRRGRRPLPPGGRDSDGTARGALRRRGAAVAPAGAAGTAGGDPHERRGPRDPCR